MNNPIIQEVRSARQALAAKFDFDLHRIFADARTRQATRKAAKPRPKPEQEACATTSPRS